MCIRDRGTVSVASGAPVPSGASSPNAPEAVGIAPTSRSAAHITPTHALALLLTRPILRLAPLFSTFAFFMKEPLDAHFIRALRALSLIHI